MYIFAIGPWRFCKVINTCMWRCIDILWRKLNFYLKNAVGNVFKVSCKSTVLRFLCNMEYHTTANRSQLFIKNHWWTMGSLGGKVGKSTLRQWAGVGAVGNSQLRTRMHVCWAVASGLHRCGELQRGDVCCAQGAPQGTHERSKDDWPNMQMRILQVPPPVTSYSSYVKI